MQLETGYKSSADSITLQNILKLKNEYNHILSAQVQDQLFKLKQKHFEHFVISPTAERFAC